MSITPYKSKFSEAEESEVEKDKQEKFISSDEMNDYLTSGPDREFIYELVYDICTGAATAEDVVERVKEEME